MELFTPMNVKSNFFEKFNQHQHQVVWPDNELDNKDTRPDNELVKVK